MTLKHIYFNLARELNPPNIRFIDDRAIVFHPLYKEDPHTSLLFLAMPDSRENVYSSALHVEYWRSAFDSKKIGENRGFALSVVRANPIMYFALPGDFRVGPEVFDAQLKLMKSITEKVLWGLHASEIKWVMLKKLAEDKDKAMALIDIVAVFVKLYSEI